MKSLLDVRAYLAGDVMTCLICGRAFRGLGHHIPHAHGITAREYKVRFGLPVTHGLEAPAVREARGAAVKATRAAGRLAPPLPFTPVTKPSKPPYALQDMRRDDAAAAIRMVITHLQAGMTLTEAAQQPGLPKWSALHTHMKRDPALRRAFDEAVEALPFDQQARMKKLGTRFATAVKALQGLTNEQAAHRLGVSEEVVRRTRKRLEAATAQVAQTHLEKLLR